MFSLITNMKMKMLQTIFYPQIAFSTRLDVILVGRVFRWVKELMWEAL
jgi:hypothetical protein